MSLADARGLTIAEYAGLFAEFNYRNDPERSKDGVEPPSEAFVLEQMALLKSQGIRIN